MVNDSMIAEALVQINAMRNNNNATLDLAFLDVSSVTHGIINEASHVLSIIDNHHPPFEIDLTVPRINSHNDVVHFERLNFKLINFDAFKQFLLNQDWSDVISAANIDDAVHAFNVIVVSWMQEHVPKMRPPSKPPWSNAALRRLKREKNAAQRRYRRNRNHRNRRCFNFASRNYQHFNISCYRRHVARTQANLRSNPKSFWTFVNSKRKDSVFPVSMFLGDDTASTTTGKVNLFATHFASVFSSASTPSHTVIHNATSNVPAGLVNLDVFHVSDEMVLQAAKKLKTSYAAGPDGIPAVVLKKCSVELMKPLTNLFNRSLSSGTFPTKWKHSFMFPVYKKGDKRNIANYRGITSLCSVSKLLELVVHNFLFFRYKSYISFDQHGFYPGRSVTTNLLEFTSTCLNQMENNLQVDAIYTDLKAAFDRIDREILLAKLAKLGMSDRFLCWMRSYLHGRTLRVKLGINSSLSFSSSSGVPQGSNLGPLLFSIFINDVCNALPEGCRLLYADDVKIFFVVRTVNDCIKLQQILNQFAEWCDWNRIDISIEKCAVISFTRRKTPTIYDYQLNNIVLPRVTTVKDLGVTLDTRLNFNTHRLIVVQKANRQLGFIKKVSSEFTDVRCFRSLYCSLVRPILEHASVVWTPFHESWIDRIEQVQKRFIEFALRSLYWREPQNRTSYSSRCQLLELESLHVRRKICQAVFVAKVLQSEIDSPAILMQLQLYVPERPLRIREFLNMPFHRSEYGRFEPISFMRSTFLQAIDQFEIEASSTTFRNKLRNYRVLEEDQH